MDPTSQQVSEQNPVSANQVSQVKKSSKKLLYGVLGIIVLLLFIIIALVFKIPNHSFTSQQTVQSNNNVTSSTTMQNQVQVTAVPNQILESMGSTNDVTNLPVGDGKYTTTSPKKGYIYLCRVMQGGGGAQETGSWFHGTSWSLIQKPSVQGKVNWPSATFSNTISGVNRMISGNDLPVNTTTGTFPVQSTDPAYQYDRNPNTITAHQFSLALPVKPTYSSTPSCMGGEVGVMLNGVPLFNGFDAENRDAAAHEIQDSCDGHPQESGEYHYHSLSSCIKDIQETSVIGFALDGYPITGPVLSNGKYLTTSDLDECHGITSSIVLDGKQTTMYHYVMTEDFPYSVSCFHAKPVQMQVIAGQNSGQNQNNNQKNNQMQPSGQQSNQSVGQQGQHNQPPQAAISACSGQSKDTSCSFTTPNGTISGSCQIPPNQTSEVCVPNNHP